MTVGKIFEKLEKLKTSYYVDLGDGSYTWRNMSVGDIAKKVDETVIKINEIIDILNEMRTPEVAKKCALCGKEFIREHNRQKYCSKKCRLEANIILSKLHNSQRKEYNHCYYIDVTKEKRRQKRVGGEND